MKGFLTAQEVTLLKEAHHDSRFRKQADRIKSILFLHEGISYADTARLLMLDSGTIRRYKKDYHATGVEGLLEYRYQGSHGFLSVQQEQDLTHYLRQHTYQTLKEVVAYTEETYKVTYSIEGMTHLLHRLGFVYKKTKVLPGKVNLVKQEQFKNKYEQLKATKKPKDRIYFVDASHPQHNTQPFYGWIFKGDTKVIRTNTGRKRVNVNGALNLEDMDITVLAESTINTHAMIRLILTLEEKQLEGDIYLILDNASYNHSYELALFLTDHPRVHLIFLPAYSPNLNIIERLWKFYHEKHRDKYFEQFKEFEQAVLSFFATIKQYDAELRTLLTDSFQTLPTF
jgi:transposase